MNLDFQILKLLLGEMTEPFLIVSDLDGTLTRFPGKFGPFLGNPLTPNDVTRPAQDWTQQTLKILFDDFEAIVATKNNYLTALNFLKWADVKNLPTKPETLNSVKDLKEGWQSFNYFGDSENFSDKVAAIRSILDTFPSSGKLYYLEDSKRLIPEVILLNPRQVVPVDCSDTRSQPENGLWNQQNWIPGQLSRFIQTKDPNNLTPDVVLNFLEQVKNDFEPQRIGWIRFRELIDQVQGEIKVGTTYINVTVDNKVKFRMNFKTFDLFTPSGKTVKGNLLQEQVQLTPDGKL